MSAGPYGLRAARAMDAILRQIFVPCKLEKCGRRATRSISVEGITWPSRLDHWCSDHAPVRANKLAHEETVHELEQLIREGNNPDRPSVRNLQPFLPQKVCQQQSPVLEHRPTAPGRSVAVVAHRWHCSLLEGHSGPCSFDR